MATRILSPLLAGALLIGPFAAPAVAKPKPNKLTVQFVGTASPSALPITVRGPKRDGKRWKRTIKASKTFKRVPRGTYRITSPVAAVAIEPGTVRMKRKSRKTVTVRFPAVPDTTPPGPVTNLGVDARNIHRVQLSWKAPADAASVIVRRTYGNAPAASPDAGAPVNAADDVGLIPATRYTYTAFARDAAGNTSPAASITTTTLAEPIVAGAYHTCAIVTGALKCWGLDNHAQLGDGPSKTNRNTPQDVVGLPAGVDVVDVGAGDFHTCAVLITGQLWCWGENNKGQIGDGSLGADKTSVVQVPSLNGVVAVDGGAAHTCALLDNGQVWCWGDNLRGQLGTGFTNAGSANPVAVAGLTDAVAISVEGDRSCAVRATGAVVCWGIAAYGQIGDGELLDRNVPTGVLGVTNASFALGGTSHTCAIAGGALGCWGRNTNGQLGDGTPTDRPTSAPVGGLAPRILTASGGLRHTCALDDAGAGACWGANDNKQLGRSGAPATDQRTPIQVTNLTGATTLVSGYFHTCALLPEGTVKCWGANLQYQLGTGNDTPSDVPIPVVSLDVYP